MEAESPGHVIKNLNVTFNKTLSGIIKEAKNSITNVTFDNINIQTAVSGNYVGVILRNLAVLDNVNFNNITITAKKMNYVGVIANNSSLQMQNVNLDNIKCYGISYVSGFMAYSESGTFNNITGNNLTISATGSYVGGLTGLIAIRTACSLSYLSVENSNIAGGQYTGGIFGVYGRGKYFYSTNNIIKGTSYVGGIAGYLTYYIHYSYAQGTTVEGKSNVGGVVGQLRYYNIGYTYNNSKVTATQGVAGGIVGLLNNTDMTAANYTSRIYNNYVADSTVIAPTKVGGVIGDIIEPLYGTGFYYQNYVESSLICNDEKVSLGVGAQPAQNYKLTNTYFYKGSKIDTDNFTEDKYLTLADLKNQDTYKKKLKWTSGFNYSALNKGKYPYVSVALAEDLVHQTGIDLPKEGVLGKENEQAMMLTSGNVNNTGINDEQVMMVQELPNTEVYTVDVNKINIEFNYINQGINFQYKIGDTISEKIPITQKVYTFKYDFKNQIELTIENGINTKIYQIKPDEISNKAQIINKEYFYLSNTKLYSNERAIDGQFVNIHDGQVLSDTGYIYDILTLAKLNDEQIQGLVQLTEEEPVIESTYENKNIKTYNNFTLIQDNEEEVERAKQIFVKNGILSVLDGELKVKNSGIIIDYYNEKEYQTILAEDGKLYDLKEKLNYPSGFNNEKIMYITNNLKIEDKEVVVYYESGRVYVFNYVTGKVIYDNNLKEDISLLDYIKQSLVSNENLYTDTKTSYEESKVLEEKLKETPILQQENLNKVQENVGNYVTVYEPISQKFAVYKQEEVLDTKQEEAVSENRKIESKIQLSSYYNYNSPEFKNKKTSGVVWFVVIILSVVIVLGILYQKLKK